MTPIFGSIPSGGMASPASAAIDHADSVVDAAERHAEQAAEWLAMVKPQPSRAERQRTAQEHAQPADETSAEPGDDGPSSSASPALDMGQLSPSMAGVFERAAHAPLHRMPGDAAPIKRLDRRRKRNC